MCVYPYTRICAYTYISLREFAQGSRKARASKSCVCICVRTSASRQICTYVQMSECTYVRMYVYTYVRINNYTYITSRERAQGSRKARASKYQPRAARAHRLCMRHDTYTNTCVDIRGYACACALFATNSRKELAQGTRARTCARTSRKQARASSRLFDLFL